MPQKVFSYTIVLHPDEKGGFWVSVPALPGCFSQGQTESEAIEMAKEAIQCHLEGLAQSGEPIPDPGHDDGGAKFEKIEVGIEIQ
jgi:predicted RNase H-like HicB family nuclease